MKNNDCGCDKIKVDVGPGIQQPVSTLIVASESLKCIAPKAARVAQFKVKDFESPINQAMAMEVAKSVLRVQPAMNRAMTSLVTEIMEMMLKHGAQLDQLAAAQPRVKPSTKTLPKPKK